MSRVWGEVEMQGGSAFSLPGLQPPGRDRYVARSLHISQKRGLETLGYF